MLCTKELKNMNTRQIESKIREWEDLYAEAFSDGADPSALNLIREKIGELREEMKIRSSISS